MAGLLAVVACGCDDHEPAPSGKISHGPSEPSAEPSERRVRLSYDPGSPLDTARVAARFKTRLAAVKDAAKGVEIGGKNVLVELPRASLDAAKKALEGGRLDVYLADDDPSFDPDAIEAPLSVRSDTSDGGKSSYVLAPAGKREALARALGPESEGHLVGPLYQGKDEPSAFRSYHVDRGSSVRGEHLSSAAVRQHGKSIVLDLVFGGAGKSFVRWGSKQGARFVLRLDGEVIATARPSDEIVDGRLSFPIEPRTNLASTLQAARALAEAIDGRALSHAVVLESEEPVD